MDKVNIVEGIVERLKDGFSIYEIEEFLNRKGVIPDEFAVLIQKAEEDLLAEMLRVYPKQNKLTFGIWLFATIVFLVLFLFVIPRQNIADGVLLISIFGATCISLCGIKVMQYYKTWEPDFIKKHGKPNLDWSAVLAVSFIPVFILTLIINTLFSSHADDILKLTQEDAIATVIDGNSVEGRKINYASITVQFTTKDGKTFVAEEDLSTYDFRKFYKGQTINIVYSKENPRNIDLLIDDESVREFKDTQERELAVNDLLVLINRDEKDFLNILNAICIGWNFNENKSVWMNEKRQNVIKYDSNLITFFTSSSNQKMLFSRELTKLGFKKTGKDAKLDNFGIGDEVFENDKYIISLRSINMESQLTTLVEVYKK